MVGNRHELGKHGSTKDRVVAGFKVCYFEGEILGAVIFLSAKSHWEGNSPNGVCGSARYDAIEQNLAWGKLVGVEAHTPESVVKMMLSPVPPLMSTFERRTLLTVGATTRGMNWDLVGGPSVRL